MGVLIAVHCSHCQSIDVIKNGSSSTGQQRFCCLNGECPYQTFGLDSAYPGRKREVKQQIVEMTLNGSGVRDIARVLHVSPSTVIQVLKKLAGIETVNPLLLGQLQPENIEVEIQRVEELEEESIEQSELDEMWSFVGKKTNPR